VSKDLGEWYPSASFLHDESRKGDLYDSGEDGDDHCYESKEPPAMATGKDV
jgi:hypothetical protein